MTFQVSNESLFTIGTLISHQSSLVGMEDLEKSTLLSIISKLIRSIAKSGNNKVCEQNGWHLYRERIDTMYHELMEGQTTDYLLRLVESLEHESVHEAFISA